MMTTIYQCFHWIGYHLTTNLLQEGYEVIGIDPMFSPLSEQLYMFVGRNSNFQHFYTVQDKEKHVHTNEEEKMINIQGNVLVIEETANSKATNCIELPPLFGEWMDLDELGINQKEELAEWVADTKAVYIEDLVKVLIPAISKGEWHPSLHSLEGREENLEKKIANTWDSYFQLQKLNSKHSY